MNRHFDKPVADADRGSAREQNPLLSLPRVNVIVACFNYGRFVGEALDSVAAQTYAAFDCVVVDDASTDNSFEIIEQWIANRGDGRFRLIRNERNLGQMGSFVAALAVSEGEFIAVLDADDIWFPEFLTRHIEMHLNRALAAGVSSSDLVQVDAKGRMLTGSMMEPAFVANQPKEAPLGTTDIPAIAIHLDPAHSELREVKYIFPDWGFWHWGLGRVYRRPLVELLVPADTEKLRLGADIYLTVLGHWFTGSLTTRTALGTYRRHGKNNFSSQPVLGSPGTATFSATIDNLRNAQRAMLDHLLEADGRLSAVFAPVRTRKLARKLFRYFLQQKILIDDPRLIAVIGRRRVLSDRLRAKFGFLQTK